MDVVIAPKNATPTESFAKTEKFTTSGPFTPEYVCLKQNGTFYRAHYYESYGGECTSFKSKEGFSSLAELSSRCEIIPCCFAGPLSEYSLKYDYFECGYK